ncbi:MAG: hypothetical protein IPN83_00070 [Holophagales bacterium]|nr:hypothetical protein [Holophagales bacterium]
MSPEAAAALAFDVDAFLEEAARAVAAIPPAERSRHRAAVDRARFDAARFLLQRGSAVDRQLAARFAFGAPLRAA